MNYSRHSFITGSPLNLQRMSIFKIFQYLYGQLFKLYFQGFWKVEKFYLKWTIISTDFLASPLKTEIYSINWVNFHFCIRTRKTPLNPSRWSISKNHTFMLVFELAVLSLTLACSRTAERELIGKLYDSADTTSPVIVSFFQIKYFHPHLLL